MTRLPPELVKTVETLNDLTPEQVDEARRLARTHRAEATSYLEQLVVKCHLGWAAEFLADVLLGSADVHTWGIHDSLCVSDAWNELVTQPIKSTLAVVEALQGDGLVRQVPRMSAWDNTPFCGAPGAVVRAKPYWWRPPDGATWTSRTLDLEPITHPVIAGRRWIASRVARRLELGERALPATPAEVAAALELKAPMSRDGEIAVAGLIREQGMTANAEMAPGFRGPDEWYA